MKYIPGSRYHAGQVLSDDPFRITIFKENANEPFWRLVTK